MIKRNNKKWHTVAAILFMLPVLWACTDKFSDINKSGTPDEEQAKGDFFYIGTHFLTLQRTILICTENNDYQYNESLTGHPYARYLTITKDAWNMSNFCVFNASINWLNKVFNDQMTLVYTAWFKLKEYRDAEEVADFAWAWAEILRVAAVQRTTDMYGPLPYSKIKDGTGSLYVPYDSQEDVYKGLFADLEGAIAILKDYTAGGMEYTALSDYDLIYNGDFTKWLRFANSLRLRMAMRIAFVDPDNAKVQARAALDPANGGVFTSNDHNALIEMEGMVNPLWVMQGSYADTRAAAELTCYLNGYDDPRLNKYLAPVTSAPGQTPSPNVGKYAGMRVGIEIPSNNWALENFSLTQTKEFDPVILFTASEIAFLKAEIVGYWKWDGMGISETAEELYNEGIRLSFAQWGASKVDEYLADDTSVPAAYTDDSNYSAGAPSSITIKWEESASDEEKLERIITQKWIALFPIGHEAWTEHRRTGYPRFFEVPVNRSTDNTLNARGASRIPYGPSEKENNPTNYEAAVSTYLGGTDGYGVRLWWDVKPNKPGW